MIIHSPNKKGYNAYECALKLDGILFHTLIPQPTIPKTRKKSPIINNIAVPISF